jgi:hypothetical protein
MLPIIRVIGLSLVSVGYMGTSITAIATPHSVSDLRTGVVKIIATVGGQERIGTGFVVKLENDAAWILTASHVIGGDPNPQITFYSERDKPRSGEIMGSESGNPKGLACILVEGDIPSGAMSLSLNAESDLQGGEDVTVLGSSLGMSWAMTQSTFAGRTGSDLVISGPVGEGSFGSPILKDRRVVGVVTKKIGLFSHGTPAGNAIVLLERWGVKLDVSTGTPGTHDAIGGGCPEGPPCPPSVGS